MTNNNHDDMRVGDVYAYCWGYSMILYKFFKVVNITDKSVMLQEYDSKTDPSTTDGWRPLVVPDFNSPIGKPKRKSLKSYFGTKWDGKPCQEDHWD